MLEDLKRALARVQSDYGFYVECQTSPNLALARYDLSPDERLMLTDPMRLADALRPEVEGLELRAITITISGKHDWVNSSAPKKKMTELAAADHDAQVVAEVAAIRRASTTETRSGAAVRLMGLIG